MLDFQLSQKKRSLPPPPPLVNDKVQWASGGARRKSDTIFVERENDALL